LEKDDPDYVLRGKTLQIYLYLLKKSEPQKLTDIQIALRFSSPGLVSHHLDKLMTLGVVSKDANGKYVLERKVDLWVLRGFANIGTFFLPRLVFYVGFSLSICVIYVLTNIGDLNALALAGLIGAVAILSYESWRVWKKRPF
jgi:hypothetical protein